MPDPIVTDVFYEYRAPAHMKGETLVLVGRQFPIENGKLRIPAHFKTDFERCGFYEEFEPIKAAFERADDEMERIRAVHREAIDRAALQQYAPDFESVKLATPTKAAAEKAEGEESLPPRKHRPEELPPDVDEPQTPLVAEGEIDR